MESPPAPPSSQRRGMVLLAAFLGWMFDGLEMGIFPLVARPALQQMQALSGVIDDGFVGKWMGIVTAAFLLGAAAGGFLFGWLGDKIGRVRAMTVAILFYSLFTGLVYFAQEPWHLAAMRFIAALGMGGEWALGVALVMEVWPEKHRPMLAGVIGAAANVGFALIACVGIVYSVTQATWRNVILVGALPAVLTFVIRLFVPESEKWQQANKARPTQPVREILADPKLIKLVLICILVASVTLIGTWGSVQWLPLWADQMVGPSMPKAKAYTQVWSAIGSVVGCLVGAWLGGLCGRRWAYFLLCVGSLGSCAWLFRGIDSYGTPFLALTFTVGAITAAFYGLLPLYLPELFPTRVRATGQGVAFNAGRILAAVGALQAGVLVKSLGGYAASGAMISLVYLAGMVVIWLLPETKGKPLPE
ncbi:MAG TPA: MFS transporter [Opitutaceae bacterium]|nr:MFS transporter [Opitutaceae bacterium]